MAEIKILDKEALTLSEVGGIVKGKELSPVQQKVREFTTKFSKLGMTGERALVKDIAALNIPRMDGDHIALIVNLTPKNINELRTVFAGSAINLTEENLQKIMDVLGKHAK